ncbi:hypothetical protein A675_00906 [Salmonella enterica subsp. enterica serovar Enteritidis str. 2009K1726]|uniref:Uncharacterized protein n=2 Tax=Salmonella enterica I TaxID=59201 RepID=A0A6C6YYK8_SALPB|nr:hypothetical protein SPAB_00580 [Salmonella enterica subsp. enterica serovar Paratyphi B str. SPB7]EPI69378.1 hypothetical protein A673_02575 [Salmonella enterica subsp. enterica serovar Enteritidis str. 2009K0958]EPI91874.1 hypothetical protein A675_00906 [Salmonella enterica subsp. enterica serovar Enteritidis str. 2009K1726]EPJ05251.1 hypothetical protein A679_00856 [Salmonella enterica subsp. enterica serovar Enteritidis str. 2010K-0284]
MTHDKNLHIAPLLLTSFTNTLTTCPYWLRQKCGGRHCALSIH